MCLQAFDEDIDIRAGTSWVQCMCTRWLHEDCIIDESGQRNSVLIESLHRFFNFIIIFFLNRLHANKNFNCALRNAVTGAHETQRIDCLVEG